MEHAYKSVREVSSIQRVSDMSTTLQIKYPWFLIKFTKKAINLISFVFPWLFMCINIQYVYIIIYCLLFGRHNSNYISYLKADVVSSEVDSKNGNWRTVWSPSSRICSVIPCYSCVKISLTLKYQICLVGVYYHFFPANTW